MKGGYQQTTVEYRHKEVQHNMILQVVRQRPKQILNQRLYSHDDLGQNWPRYNGPLSLYGSF